MKKLAVVVMTLFVFSANAFAADVCKDTSKLVEAAKKAFAKKETPQGDGNDPEFHGQNKAGTEDKWIIEMGVDEECLTSVVLWTKAGTCKVVGTPTEIGQRDCG